MNPTNIKDKIEPHGVTCVAALLKNTLNQEILQPKRLGVPIMPHINHPNFFCSVSLQDMIALDGERFFEVYNGHPMVHNMGDSTHISTEEMWDLINISRLQDNKPLMYGLATDDSHHYHRKGKEWSNAGRGWVMVQADTLSPGSLIRSLEAGDFYSSTGVALKKLHFEENTLSVEVEEEAGISYTISFIGCEKGDAETGQLKSVVGGKASFEITDDILFVRSKITSSRMQDNPVENMVYEMAWTQPVLRNP
jgi:hypothetical protein